MKVVEISRRKNLETLGSTLMLASLKIFVSRKVALEVLLIHQAKALMLDECLVSKFAATNDIITKMNLRLMR